MSSNLLFQTIDQISREKGIDPQIVVDAIEDAIVVASRKYFKTNEELRSRLNPDTGEVEVFAVRKVVEQVEDETLEISIEEAQSLKDDVQVDDELEFQKPTEGLGRIAAQMAKQVIFQKVREAERERVYEEYHGHVGEIVNCVVKRFENGDIIVDLGKTEGRMPRREQSRLEGYAPGERMRVVIIRVEKTTRGPQVVVSRGDAGLVQHLFQTEVPEIYDGTVQIRSIARESGERTKIAVASRERDVDPVGACVGMRGSRVQSIIRELRGEKIDIIQWSDDVVTFATNAISPAQVSRVSILAASDTEYEPTSPEVEPPPERIMEIIVEDSQLSLAIGKKGQNVRLASKLIGWRIDIKSEEEKRAEIEDEIQRLQAATPLESISGLTPGIIKKLNSADITTVEQLAELAPEDLEAVPGIGGKTIEKIRDELSEYYAAQPSYEDDLERTTQERMFARDADDEMPALEPEDAVGAEAPESVGGDAPESVGADAPETAGGDTPKFGGGDAPESVGGDAPESVGGDAPESAGADAPESVGGDAPESVGGDAPESVGGDAPESVGGDAPESVGGDAPKFGGGVPE